MKRKKLPYLKIAGEVIPRAIQHLTNAPEYKLYLIRFYWEDIVGRHLAKYTYPKNFAFGTLTIAIENNNLANNLRYMELEIRDKINEKLNYQLVKKIHFAYGVKPEKKLGWQKEAVGREWREVLDKIALSSSEEANIDAQLEQMQDRELASILKKNLIQHEKFNLLKTQKKWHPCARCQVLCPPQRTFCVHCQRQLKKEKYGAIQKLLLTKPWIRYAEIRKQIDCDEDLVNKIRSQLVQALAASVDIEQDEMALQLLVMLYRAMPPEQITPQVIEANLHSLKYDLRYEERRKLRKSGE